MKMTSCRISFSDGAAAKIARMAIPAVLFMALAGCESEPKAAVADVLTTKQVASEVESNVRDVVAKKGPKWKVEYSGDLTGSIEGGILTSHSNPTSATIAIGAGMNSGHVSVDVDEVPLRFVGEPHAILLHLPSPAGAKAIVPRYYLILQPF